MVFTDEKNMKVKLKVYLPWICCTHLRTLAKFSHKHKKEVLLSIFHQSITKGQSA